MLSAQASVFVASAPEGEASMREQLKHVVGACQVRHAHMPGISARTFAAGLGIDHARLTQSASALARLVEAGPTITCTSEDGTDLLVDVGPHRWVARLGRILPGESVNLPTGSLVVSPRSVRGTFAATASLGELHDPRERLLREPVLFDIEDGVVKGVRCAASPELVRDIENVLGSGPNCERVGLVVLGLNTGSPEPSGAVALDQHRPGLHIVVGDPQEKLTRASFQARTSLAVCAAENAVHIDGVPVMQSGRLLFS
jgi:leucyl aminopeptidase (aminopeptidase T)